MRIDRFLCRNSGCEVLGADMALSIEQAARILNQIQMDSGDTVSIDIGSEILDMVATGSDSVLVVGISIDLDEAGIREAASLLRAHPGAWMEQQPNTDDTFEVEPGAVADVHDLKPAFGL